MYEDRSHMEGYNTTISDPRFFPRGSEVGYRPVGIKRAFPRETRNRPFPDPEPRVLMQEDMGTHYRSGWQKARSKFVSVETLLTRWGLWVDYFEYEHIMGYDRYGYIEGRGDYRWVAIKNLPGKRVLVLNKFANYEEEERGRMEPWNQ